MIKTTWRKKRNLFQDSLSSLPWALTWCQVISCPPPTLPLPLLFPGGVFLDLKKKIALFFISFLNDISSSKHGRHLLCVQRWATWAPVHSKQWLLSKSLSLKVLILVSLPEPYPPQKVTATTETCPETEESIGDDKGNFEKQRRQAMSIKLPKSKKDNLNSGGIYWSQPGWSFFVAVVVIV